MDIRFSRQYEFGNCCAYDWGICCGATNVECSWELFRCNKLHFISISRPLAVH